MTHLHQTAFLFSLSNKCVTKNLDCTANHLAGFYMVATLTVTLSCKMSQNGQTHFKKSCSICDFGTLCLKGLNGFHPLSTNAMKWSNTLKQFVGCCQRIV